MPSEAKGTNQPYSQTISPRTSLVVLMVVFFLLVLLAYKMKSLPPPEPPIEVAKVKEDLSSVLRERIIDIKKMSRPLRIIVALVLLQLIVAAVLILLRFLHLPQVLIIYDSGLGRPFQVSQVIFVACFISFLLAWSFVLAGALHGHWLIRLIVLSGFSWEISDVLNPGIGGQLQLILLVLVWAWGLLIWFRNISMIQREGVGERRWRVSFIATFAFVLLVLLVNYSLTFQNSFFLQIFTDQIFILAGLSFPMIILTGTDFAEIGEEVAKFMASRIKSYWLLGILMALIALIILIYALSQFVPISYVPWFFMSLLWLLPSGIILTAMLMFVVHVCHVKNWSVESTRNKLSHLSVPFWAIAASALFSAIALVITTYVVLVILVLPVSAVYIAWQDTLIAVLIILGISGLGLMLWQRHRGGPVAATGLFLVIILLEAAYYYSLGYMVDVIVRFATFIGIQVKFNNDALLSIHSIQVVVAAATLAILLWLIAKRNLQPEKVVSLLKQLFVLNGGLQVIAWISAYFSAASSLSEQNIIFAAILLLLALLWDFFMSGKEITNPDEPRFPRYARVLLYAGYIMLVSTVVLFASNLALNRVGGQVESYLKFSTEIIEQVGLIYLGVPLLVTNFVLELTAQWNKSSLETSHEQETIRQEKPIPEYAASSKYGRIYGLRAGFISLIPIAISVVAEVVEWPAIMQFRHTHASKYIECALQKGVSACPLSRGELFLIGGIELLFYVTALLAFLFMLGVYYFAGRAAAREANRLRAGIKAALVAALVSSLMFILADVTTVAAGINIQQLFKPLATSGILGLTALSDDFNFVLGLDLLVMLPILVFTVLVGWLGALRGIRERRTPPHEIPPILINRDKQLTPSS